MSAALNNEAQYANPVPAAIRRQSKRVDDIARQVGMANAPEDPNAVSADAEIPPVAETPTVVPPVHTPPADDFEQKYRTLQGKYDAEVPALRAQINGMERLVATMREPAQREPAPVVPPQNTTVVDIPAADREAFGDDLIEAARRWALAEVSPRLNQLESTIATLKQGQTQIQATTQENSLANARQRSMAWLDADTEIGRNWRPINEDPKFWNGWLLQPDPYSGQQRLQLLREAFDTGQPVRVKAFIKAYLSEHTDAQIPAPQPVHTPAPDAGTGRPTLEELAAPGRGSGPTHVGAQPDKRIWSQANIRAFYRDVQSGAFNGREVEKTRLEQDIFAAAAEGRVR